MAKKKKKKYYSFPTVSVCPRCRSVHTRATSTQGHIQYRTCLAAICRHRYTVRGILIDTSATSKSDAETKEKTIESKEAANDRDETASAAARN